MFGEDLAWIDPPISVYLGRESLRSPIAFPFTNDVRQNVLGEVNISLKVGQTSVLMYPELFALYKLPDNCYHIASLLVLLGNEVEELVKEFDL